ncbi:MAG: hypothetical protein RL120_05355 [Gammaproteobacteria bacterium]
MHRDGEMAITTFDTHKFVRRLEKAGMQLELAEVQAEVLTEAFNVNLENLVTKDYLESQLTSRFAEQKAYIDTRFADQKADFDTRLRVLTVMVGIVLAAVVLPLLERLAAL